MKNANNPVFTIILWVSFVVVFLTASNVYCREVPIVKGNLRIPDSNHMQIITLKDGSKLIGRIVEIAGGKIQFETSIGVITIPMEKIKEIKEIPLSSIKGGVNWFPNSEEIIIPGYLWTPIGFVAGLILFTIFFYRRTAGLLFRISTGILVSLWYLSAVIFLQMFWGQVIIIVLLEIITFAVFILLSYLIERYTVCRVAIKWCRNEFNALPGSLRFLTLPLFKSRNRVRVQRGNTSWLLIITLEGLKVVSATKE